MEETTKQLLTTIAENQPKIKELGYNEGFSAGYKEYNRAFWERYQQGGKRTNYIGAFRGLGWTDETFCPIYDITPKGTSTSIFQECRIKDLKGILERHGVCLDLSEASELSNTFYGSGTLERLPVIDGSNAYRLWYPFYTCSKLRSIDELIVLETATFTSAFYDCKSLSDLTIGGVIGRDISFSASPLSVESLKSIITHLKDYSTDTANHYAYTVTFKSTAFEALEAEGSTSPNGNTWTEYIDDLKWNLTLS